MRSFLTMLGIIIGVASVIILVSIVNGYMSYMVESFSSMGVNQITVQYKAVASRSIDVNEFYEFYEEHSDLYENMSPNVSVSVTVKHDSDTMDSTSVGGYSEDYLAIKDYEIEYGRNLQYSDMEARRKVAVIGAYVAEELYGGSQNAVGEMVKLNGDSYTIVGVVERQTESSSEFDDGCMDDFVWIPYSRAVKMARNAVINNYIFTSRDINDTETCTTELKNFLYEKMKSENLYTVTAMRLPSRFPERADCHDEHDVRWYRRDLSFSCRGRCHEHHAGVRDRENQGDRHQEGPRRKEKRDHVTVRH
ncbi:MAG: ABC transporter permease [Pilosibacter sp.]